MARLAVAVAVTVTVLLSFLSLLSVSHSRLLVPTTDANTALAVSDERDAPKPIAESGDTATTTATEQFVVIPVHRLADPGFLRDLHGLSLRLPTHRRHPCRHGHGHGHGHRLWGHLHRHALAGGFPGEARAGFAESVELAHGEEPKEEELSDPKEEADPVAEPEPDSDSDSDSDGEDDDEEEMEKRWRKEGRPYHGRRHHHHDDHEEEYDEEEEGGIMKWFRDLVDRF